MFLSKATKMALIKVFATLIMISVVTGFNTSNAVDIDGSISSGYTDNLLQDSSSRTDYYTNTSVILSQSLFPFAEMSLVGDYTYYSNLFDLSNFQFGADLTLIPTSDSSSLTAYFKGSYRGREYRQREVSVINTDFN